MEKFSDLNFSPPIAKAIADMGYTVPTPVQAQTLPILLAGPTDLLGMAATGTGKTAAYGLPLLEQIDATKRVTQSVVLCPTRELAIQVTEHLNMMGKHKKVSALAIYGGAGYMDQLHGLKRGAYIIVATPGRLIDHVKRGALKLDSVTTLVFDEADEMISMGFKDSLEFILQQINAEKCHRWMFSATMNSDLRRIADTYLRAPKLVQVNRTEMLSGTVRQIYYTVQEHNKPMAICRIIDIADDFYGLIFCQTKALVTDLTDYLKMRGYKVDSLHGDKNQREREQTLDLFKRKAVNILVCSDVAARGLDVKDLTHVINFSIPFEFDSYVHRIGRTGRSGKAGLALSLVTPGQRHVISRIENRTKTRMEVGTFPNQTQITQKKIAALLPKFAEEKGHTEAAEILSPEWKKALESMSKEEVAARFVAMAHPEWFEDAKQDLNHTEREYRGGGGNRRIFPQNRGGGGGGGYGRGRGDDRGGRPSGPPRYGAPRGSDRFERPRHSSTPHRSSGGPDASSAPEGMPVARPAGHRPGGPRKFFQKGKPTAPYKGGKAKAAPAIPAAK